MIESNWSSISGMAALGSLLQLWLTLKIVDMGAVVTVSPVLSLSFIGLPSFVG